MSNNEDMNRDTNVNPDAPEGVRSWDIKGFGISVLHKPDVWNSRHSGLDTTDFRRDSMYLLSRSLSNSENTFPVWTDGVSRLIAVDNAEVSKFSTVEPFYSKTIKYTPSSPYPNELKKVVEGEESEYKGIDFVADGGQIPYSIRAACYGTCPNVCSGDGPVAGDPRIVYDPPYNPGPEACTLVTWIGEKYYLLVQNAVATDNYHINIDNSVVDVYKASSILSGKPKNNRLFGYPDGPAGNKSYLHGYDRGVIDAHGGDLGIETLIYFASSYYCVTSSENDPVVGGSYNRVYTSETPDPTVNPNGWFAGYLYAWSVDERDDPPGAGYIGKSVYATRSKIPLYWSKSDLPQEIKTFIGATTVLGSSGVSSLCSNDIIPGTAFDFSAVITRNKYAVVKTAQTTNLWKFVAVCREDCKKWCKPENGYTGCKKKEGDIQSRTLELMETDFCTDYNLEMKITQLIPVKPAPVDNNT